jgi:rhodanese-related sulfurtransferase
MNLSHAVPAVAASIFAEHGASVLRRDSGQPEVPATWAAKHRDAFRFIDVREPHELSGPLGTAGAENIPLLELLSQAEGMEKRAPLVLICRSGRRSGLVANALEHAGFADVASVEGGMLAWNLEVEGNDHIAETERVANTGNLAAAAYQTNGVPEVSARWVSENIGGFRLIDVREPAELRSMGYVVQAENVPLGGLMAAVATWKRDQPLVVMCASGGRSARAAMALGNAGFTTLASLEGGIYGWRAAGLPTVS